MVKSCTFILSAAAVENANRAADRNGNNYNNPSI
jgi:hypothetical protein